LTETHPPCSGLTATTHAARQSFDRNSSGGEAQGDGKTCFVKGFDQSAGEEVVREGLMTAFGEYGEVAEVRLPYDRENDCLKGFGYIVFAEASGAPVRTCASSFCAKKNQDCSVVDEIQQIGSSLHASAPSPFIMPHAR
jgi:hypothetical protein